VNYKKILVLILAIALLGSVSFALDLDIVDSASGVDFQLYLTSDGKLYGIGANDQGELGMGAGGEVEYDELVEITSGVLTPEEGGDKKQKRTVAAGADFSVIIKTDKRAYATGENYFGQLGVGDTASRNDFATAMKGEDNVAKENIVSVSAGADFVLLLDSNGAVYGAGDNGFGQIKQEGEASYSTLIEVYNPINNNNIEAKAIATGSRHSVILLEDGSVITLGDNEYYQRNITPQSGKKIVEIAAGSYHTLAVLRTDEAPYVYTVWGVGNNENRQLIAPNDPDHKNTKDINKYSQAMVQLKDDEGRPLEVNNPGSRIRNISAGYDFSLVVKDSSHLVGIGNNDRNQLGKEAKAKGKNKNSVKVETIDEIKNINANWRSSVIMGKNKEKNHSQSKGSNYNDAIGQEKGSQFNSKTIAMGAGHTLYVQETKVGNTDEVQYTLYGAGDNTFGQLGVATKSASVRKIPFDLNAIGGAKQIAAGAAHSVILGYDGSVWVTGYNYSGQLGLGDNVDRYAFTRLPLNFLPADDSIVGVAAGGDVTMLLTKNGYVYAMGDNSYDQIIEEGNKSYNTPQKNHGGGNIIDIAVGTRNTFVLTSVADVFSSDFFDDYVAHNIYDTVLGNANMKKIVSGVNHVLMLDKEGYIIAGGVNTYGQLGDADKEETSNGISFFKNNSITVKDMVAGYDYSLFLTDKGLYFCGRLGESIYSTPTKISEIVSSNIADPQEIAGGWLGNIVRTANSIYTIGNNVYGQRGSYRGEESSGYDDEIASLNKKKIAAGYGYTMILHDDGTLWGIGKNDKGQLGTGDNKDKTAFVKINSGLEGNIADIQAGPNYTLILTRDGEVYGTGYDKYGLFGTVGSNSTRFKKIEVIEDGKNIVSNVKKILVSSVHDDNIILIKNDNTVCVRGRLMVPEDEGVFQKNYYKFTNIAVELEDEEFIKNALLNYNELYLIISDAKLDTNDRTVSCCNTLLAPEGIKDYETINDLHEYVFLSQGKLNILEMMSGAEPKNYEKETSGEVHMVSTAGSNELTGVTFTEEIESMAAADDHIVVLTKSGQIYSAGDNTNGLLGNETLNNNGTTWSKVFVPTQIQSIKPTIGAIVK